jgi:hypothetical protein
VKEALRKEPSILNEKCDENVIVETIFNAKIIPKTMEFERCLFFSHLVEKLIFSMHFFLTIRRYIDILKSWRTSCIICKLKKLSKYSARIFGQYFDCQT